MIGLKNPWKEDREIEETLRYDKSEESWVRDVRNELDNSNPLIEFLLKRIEALEQKCVKLEDRQNRVLVQDIDRRSLESLSDLADPSVIDLNSTLDSYEMEYILSNYSDPQPHTERIRDVRDVIGVRLQPDLEMMANRLRDLFHNANDEVFKDGMSSHFSIKLRDIVLEYGIAAIDQIREIIHANDTPVEVTEETLRQIGYLNDTRTHSVRLSLLERALESQDLRIRDAASIGIEAMEDPGAIPSLERASKSEPSKWLRQYLNDVIAQLRMHNGVPEDR